VFELTHSHRVDGWRVLESGSLSYGRAMSYMPVINLLRGYFAIADRDTYGDIREKVTGRTPVVNRYLEADVPALLALMDAAADDAQWQILTRYNAASGRKTRLFASF
jgi:hypothetical protein